MALGMCTPKSLPAYTGLGHFPFRKCSDVSRNASGKENGPVDSDCPGPVDPALAEVQQKTGEPQDRSRGVGGVLEFL